MYCPLAFRIIVILMMILTTNTYFHECPNINSVGCSCYKRGEILKNIECRRIQYKELDGVFKESSQYNIYKFDIIGSKLVEVNKTLFSNMSVKILEFSFCDVETFHIFKGLDLLRNLRTLILDFVKVKRWVFTSADGSHEFNEMREFIMQDCHKENINDTQIINYLPKTLTSITIRLCRMRSEEGNSFSRFTDLEKLDLSNNLLTNLQPNLLPRPPKHLRVLNLSQNPIKSISKEMFLDMPKLSFLYLEATSIVTLRHEIIQPVLKELRSFQIAHNPFLCDCYNSWILTQVFDWTPEYYSCAAPERMKGEWLANLTPKNMCQPKGESYKEAMDEYCDQILQ